MFCTSCGSKIATTPTTCPHCGIFVQGEHSSGNLAVRDRFSGFSHFLRSLLAILPVVTLILLAAGYAQHNNQVDRQRAAAYQQSLTAFEAGNYVAAQAGFAALGEYRDADVLLAEVLTESAPLRDQLATAQSAYLGHDFEQSLAILEEVIAAAPEYQEAIDLQNGVRAAYANELMLNASLSEARRDWVGVEHSLSGAVALQPDDTALASEYALIINTRAPMVFTRDGVVLIAGPTGDDERALTADIDARWAAWSPDRGRSPFWCPHRKAVDSTRPSW